jgi:hypothetical protein
VTDVEVWRPHRFSSETQIVSNNVSGEPWYYVIYPGVGIVDYNVRYAMTDDLAKFLNGGPRPAWLDDMERVSHRGVVGPDGSGVEICGPMYDANPPNLDWRTCEDEAAREKRAALIDRLGFPAWIGR